MEGRGATPHQNCDHTTPATRKTGSKVYLPHVQRGLSSVAYCTETSATGDSTILQRKGQDNEYVSHTSAEAHTNDQAADTPCSRIVD